MRTALVTGANRGLGYAIAAGLSRLGDIKVLVGSRRAADGEAAARSLGGSAVAVALDLAAPEGRRRQLRDIVAAHGGVDILVNNAGVLDNGTLFEIDEDKLNRSLQVNFLAPLDLVRELVPGMIERGYGRVVNISSGWGSFAEGLAGPDAYSVTKAALNALTLSVAKDLPGNVKINSLNPGWVRTRMGGRGASRSPEEAAEAAVWLATLPADGPSGGFFRDRRTIAW